MIDPEFRRVLSVLLSFALFTGSSTILSGFQGSSEQRTAESGPPTQTAPMSESELKALVAPIAL